MEDAQGYGQLLADPKVHPYVLDDGPLAADAVAPRIARKQAQWADRTGATWAVVCEDRFVGYVALHFGGPRVAISYALLPCEHGQGFAREAVTAVLGRADTLSFSELEARTHHGNEASVRLLLATGFGETEPCNDPPRRRFVWAVDAPGAVVTQFCAALDSGDWKRAAALLAPRCVYDCRGSTTVGVREIVASYKSIDDWVRRSFEHICYRSSIETRPGDKVLISFRDRMAHGEHRLDFRCQQLVSVVGGAITHIEHIDLPGERDKANLFNRTCGVTRP